MRVHGIDSAPRTESCYPTVASLTSRRRFVGTALVALALGAVRLPTVVSARQAIFAPAELTIPSIGLDATIQQIHIVEGVMEAPDDPWKVGWYSQLSFPGQGTNVVMAGHKDWQNIGPAVFWDLTMLRNGNEISLTSASGDVLTYLVESVDQLAVATPPSEYTETDGHEMLTLITCAGSYDGDTYDERLIVRALLQH